MFWVGIFLLIVFTVFGMVMLVTYDSTPDGPVSEVSDADWTKGVKGGVVLMEYSDLQCPACASYYPLVKQLMVEYGMRIQFVYRHFPLERIHPNALPAAYAADAAGKQGKFWSMHDLLFDRQKEWSPRTDAQVLFEQYATQLGLDLAKFKQDMQSEEVKRHVRENAASGEKAGVDSTPSFFLNGKKIPNPRSYAEFKAQVSSVLGK